MPLFSRDWYIYNPNSGHDGLQRELTEDVLGRELESLVASQGRGNES